jgi:hypothetical protein
VHRDGNRRLRGICHARNATLGTRASPACPASTTRHTPGRLWRHSQTTALTAPGSPGGRWRPEGSRQAGGPEAAASVSSACSSVRRAARVSTATAPAPCLAALALAHSANHQQPLHFCHRYEFFTYREFTGTLNCQPCATPEDPYCAGYVVGGGTSAAARSRSAALGARQAVQGPPPPLRPPPRALPRALPRPNRPQGGYGSP